MRILALLALFLIGSATVASAAEDVTAGQSVIRAQEEALSRDDAATAYTFASPGIQRRFHDPETFLSMVRNGYTPVYRHRSFEFGEAKTSDGAICRRSTSSTPTAWPGRRSTRWRRSPTEA